MARPEDQPHLSWRNLGNAILLIVVPLPSILAVQQGVLAGLHPIVAVNLLFFLNVSLLFWLVSLVQKSCWLIDPYWTIIPLFIGHYYAAHPTAVSDPWRSRLALGCLWLWSLRLTFNYFRRERYRFGAREDWRFAKKRAETKHFWWYSFFYAYLSQQLMLVGLTLPLWAIHQTARPLSAVDGILAAAAVAGVVIAHVADGQLASFMASNRERRARGQEPLLILDTGLWRYSRHPNYFGEQLFWWSLAAWGIWVGFAWTAIGAVINSAGLAVVTLMTERRMTDKPERRQAWAAYAARTSVWIPWPPRRAADAPPCEALEDDRRTEA